MGTMKWKISEDNAIKREEMAALENEVLESGLRDGAEIGEQAG
jgi:hypothetical protein